MENKRLKVINIENDENTIEMNIYDLEPTDEYKESVRRANERIQVSKDQYGQAAIMAKHVYALSHDDNTNIVDSPKVLVKTKN